MIFPFACSPGRRLAGAWFALLTFALTPGLAAALPAEELEDRVDDISELLDTQLPGALGRSVVSVRFMPRLGDLRNREFLRLPLELRYGLNERTDLWLGLSSFVPNPSRRGPDHRSGPGVARVELRRELRLPARWNLRADGGVEVRAPLGRPPELLSDGFAQLETVFSAVRPLPGTRDGVGFLNLRHNWGLPYPSRPAEVLRARRSADTEVVPGILYQPGAVGAFLEHHFRRIREEGKYFSAPETRLGVRWEIPVTRSRALFLPGYWQAELAYRHFHLRRLDSEFASGVVARVGWNLGLKGRPLNQLQRMLAPFKTRAAAPAPQLPPPR
ncbi:MAG: hypothetical protein RLZZ447_911 [Verrucomicrobiota bacterium]|jgi:hypothetical protein